ncbi:hypothetical protein RHGRI_030313 [Rhododendron griersonianum]|uniref:Legume lectin domain-containing protein n=1 Tax=Rhododendron griersonianum TaxID=479676 RepID=A0AAV6INP1_9ERIC|nr:hypothetical protein RHGRI_030313 [Rhododendron griersonianum]
MGLAANPTTPVVVLPLLLSLLAAAPPVSAKLKTFNIQLKNFFDNNSDTQKLQLANAHSAIGANGALQLPLETPNGDYSPPTNQAGRILYKIPFKLWEGRSDADSDRVASFNTSFLVNMYRLDGFPTPGEGIAFVVAPDLDIPPNGSLEYLGLTNAATNGNTSNHLIAVELDTFKQDFDPNSHDVGLNINSVRHNGTASWLWQRTDRQMSGKVKSMPGMPREYQYRELQKATNNFEETRKLGQGGYGVVYKGYLENQNSMEVAVKMFSRESLKVAGLGKRNGAREGKKKKTKAAPFGEKGEYKSYKNPSHSFSSSLISVSTLHSPHQEGSDAAFSRIPPTPDVHSSSRRRSIHTAVHSSSRRRSIHNHSGTTVVSLSPYGVCLPGNEGITFQILLRYDFRSHGKWYLVILFNMSCDSAKDAYDEDVIQVLGCYFERPNFASMGKPLEFFVAATAAANVEYLQFQLQWGATL